MTLTRLVRAGWMAAGLMVAGPAVAQTVTSLPVTDAKGVQRYLQVQCFTVGGQSLCAPTSIGISPSTGSAYTLLNAQPTAPGIAAGYPVSRSVAMTGSAQVVMAAVTTTPRKAGYCQVSFAATGTVTLSVTGTAAAPPNIANDVELVAGQSFDLNQHGYAEQGAVSAYGTHAGDILMCQEVQ